MLNRLLITLFIGIAFVGCGNLYSQKDDSKKEYYLTDDSQVLLSGKIYLIKEITESGDTIFEKNLRKKIKVTAIQFDGEKQTGKRATKFSQSDSTYLYIDFDRDYTIYYSCGGYNTKGLRCYTYDIPSTTLGYKVGFEFPYRLYLIKRTKSKKHKKKVVATLSYDKENEYFDFKLNDD